MSGSCSALLGSNDHVRKHERRFLGAFKIPPLKDMTDAEIDDMAAVIADTIADQAARHGEKIVRREKTSEAGGRGPRSPRSKSRGRSHSQAEEGA